MFDLLASGEGAVESDLQINVSDDADANLFGCCRRRIIDRAGDEVGDFDEVITGRFEIANRALRVFRAGDDTAVKDLTVRAASELRARDKERRSEHLTL